MLLAVLYFFTGAKSRAAFLPAAPIVSKMCWCLDLGLDLGPTAFALRSPVQGPWSHTPLPRGFLSSRQ